MGKPGDSLPDSKDIGGEAFLVHPNFSGHAVDQNPTRYSKEYGHDIPHFSRPVLVFCEGGLQERTDCNAQAVTGNGKLCSSHRKT